MTMTMSRSGLMQDVYAPQASPKARNLTSLRPVHAKTKRIGLVDGDDKVRSYVSRTLARSGTLQLWFDTNNVQGAIDWMRSCCASDWPDIWLVDLSLPDGSGLAVIDEALTLHPDTHVIVMSATCDEKALLDSLDAGASGYLLKGVNGQRLVEHIHDLMDGGAAFSPEIARRLVAQIRALSARVPQEQQSSLLRMEELTLTRREVLTLKWIARGRSYAEVAEILKVKTNTIRYYVKNIYRKMKVGSKTEALYEARRRGWKLDV